MTAEKAAATPTPENPPVDPAAFKSIEAPGTEHVLRIPLFQLRPSPTNPRKSSDPKADADLAASIKENAAKGGPGILEPLLCRHAPEGTGKIEIVAGWRRYKAAIKAGLDDVPCILREMTDADALEVQIIENLQRLDVSPIDEARGFQVLNKTMKVEAIAKKIGKSASYVYMSLKLCDLGKKATDLMEAGSLPPGHATQIARLNETSQAAAIEYLYPKWNKESGQNGPAYSVRQLAEFIKHTAAISLTKATFDTKDELLLKGVPSCTNCPKRAGNNRDFKDLPPDSCTDRKCNDEKTEKHVQNILTTWNPKANYIIKLHDQMIDKPAKPDAAELHYGQFVEASTKRDSVRKPCRTMEDGLWIDGPIKGTLIKLCRNRKCETHYPPVKKKPTSPKADCISSRAIGLAVSKAINAPRLAGHAVVRLIFDIVQANYRGRIKLGYFRGMQNKTVDRLINVIGKDEKAMKAATEKDLTQAILLLTGAYDNTPHFDPKKFRAQAAKDFAKWERPNAKPNPPKAKKAKAPKSPRPAKKAKAPGKKR